MTAFSTARKSVVATVALGIVVFSLSGLDSTLKPNRIYAANAVTQTTAQV